MPRTVRPWDVTRSRKASHGLRRESSFFFTSCLCILVPLDDVGRDILLAPVDAGRGFLVALLVLAESAEASL